jgi:hypothetical protein
MSTDICCWMGMRFCWWSGRRVDVLTIWGFDNLRIWRLFCLNRNSSDLSDSLDLICNFKNLWNSTNLFNPGSDKCVRDWNGYRLMWLRPVQYECKARAAGNTIKIVSSIKIFWCADIQISDVQMILSEPEFVELVEFL